MSILPGDKFMCTIINCHACNTIEYQSYEICFLDIRKTSV